MSTNTTWNSSTAGQTPIVCYIISYIYNGTRFILVVPLCIFILYQAFQQWQQQRSFSTTSHSDLFTFHTATMEIFWVLGTVAFNWSYSDKIHTLPSIGTYLIAISYFGQSFFHMLTCVERYLAVVHPITYRGLKSRRGILIRNISIGSVWFLCFIISSVFVLEDQTTETATLLTVSGSSLLVISFCSVSVLRVLIRPGPGEGGRDRERVDQLKLRAFFTIMIIMAAIWLWFIPFFVSNAVLRAIQRNDPFRCVVISSMFWCNLPSSLVLPLLYLHRTGRLACRHSNE